MQHAALLGTKAPAPLSPAEALSLLEGGEPSAADGAALDEAVGALELSGAAAELWCKKESFLAEHFDPEEYLKDLRRYVPLDALRAALEAHLGTLKNEASSSRPPAREALAAAASQCTPHTRSCWS